MALASVYRIWLWKVVAVVLFLLLLSLAVVTLLQAGVIHAGGAPVSHAIASFCGASFGPCS
jgi:hypothetical protein